MLNYEILAQFCSWHMILSGQLGQCQTFYNELWFASSVMSLLVWVCPTNIARLVVPIVVDAVNRMVRRGWLSKVRVVTAEVFYPRRVDRDTSATIVFVSAVGRAKATILHGAPSVVSLATNFAMLFPGDAFGAKFGQFLATFYREGFTVNTAARRGVVAGKIRSEDPCNIAAVAFALPSTVFVRANYN